MIQSARQGSVQGAPRELLQQIVEDFALDSWSVEGVVEAIEVVDVRMCRVELCDDGCGVPFGVRWLYESIIVMWVLC